MSFYILLDYLNYIIFNNKWTNFENALIESTQTT